MPTTRPIELWLIANGVKPACLRIPGFRCTSKCKRGRLPLTEIPQNKRYMMHVAVPKGARNLPNVGNTLAGLHPEARCNIPP